MSNTGQKINDRPAAGNATLIARQSRRMLVALDVPTLPEALALVVGLRDQVGGFKVGLELCTAAGVPAVVEAIGAAGGAVFLDLKLKDIPNTVAGAVRAIVTRLGENVRMLTLHCDGGSAMLQAAVAAAREATANPPLLLGVTVLTSIDAVALQGELGIPAALEAQVVQMAQLAQAAGLDGVVASPHEVGAIRQACGSDLLIVTPGVRPTWAASQDQRRVMTPAQAVGAGADYLVIGRPITAAPTVEGGPPAAARRIAGELAAAKG
jgi:orotidine-5'-phosphate decarboxylase